MIALAVCVAAVFTLLDNNTENICFLVCVCLTIISCIAYEPMCKFAQNFKGRLTNASQGTKHRVSAAPNPTGGDQDDPEHQSSDPLVSDSDRDRPGLELGCQDGLGLASCDALDENDGDISSLDSTADCRPGRSLTGVPDLATRYIHKQQTSPHTTGRSLTEASGLATRYIHRHQASPPTTTHCSPRRSLHDTTVGLDAPHIATQQDSSSTTAGHRSLAASEQYVHSVAEDNQDPNDTTIHGVGRPTSRHVVPIEPIKLTSGSDDSYSTKLGQRGCSRREGADDDETELSHDQLALNLRSESPAPETTLSTEVSQL